MPRINELSVDPSLPAHDFEARTVQHGAGERMAGQGLIEARDGGRRIGKRPPPAPSDQGRRFGLVAAAAHRGCSSGHWSFKAVGIRVMAPSISWQRRYHVISVLRASLRILARIVK